MSREEMNSFSNLPPEILHTILTYLPLSSLFSFGQTSSANYTHATLALRSLHLAVLPKRIHGILAFLKTATNFSTTFGSYSNETINLDFDTDLEFQFVLDTNFQTTSQIQHHQITIPTRLDQEYHYPYGSSSGSSSHSSNSKTSNNSKCNKRPKSHLSRRQHSYHRGSSIDPKTHRTLQIQLQNQKASQVLSTPILSNLHVLTLHLYDLDPTATNTLPKILATRFPHLRHLNLNFSHPYLHDPCLPADFWRHPDPNGSPAWNSLVGLGDPWYEQNLQLRNLEILKLNRGNLTCQQLLSWIQMNPNLRSLWLENCRGVDTEFLAGLLAEMQEKGSNMMKRRRRKLDYLFLPNNDNLVLHSPPPPAEMEHNTIGNEVLHGTEILRSLLTFTPSPNEDQDEESLQILSLHNCRSISASLLEKVLEDHQSSSYPDDPRWNLKTLVLPNGKILSFPLVSSSINGDGSDMDGVGSLVSGLKSPALSLNDADLSGGLNMMNLMNMDTINGEKKNEDVLEVDPACM